MKEQHPFTVGLIQMAMGEDPGVNLARAIEKIREAARRGAQAICLPELFLSRYFCQTENAALFDLAEPVPGPTTEALATLARELGVAIVGSVFERRAPGLYHNTAVVLDADGSLAGIYRKMHVPDDPSYHEKFYFAPGDLGFRAIPTRFGRLGTLICWDQWYPEAARATALRGAVALLYPTAIGWLPEDKPVEGPVQREAWRTVQRGHAVANGLYVAAANRVGWEPSPTAPERGIEFWGSSFLCDPQGVILAEASADREEILLGEIDPRRIEAVRRGWPFLRDRRIDAYGALNQRYVDESE